MAVFVPVYVLIEKIMYYVPLIWRDRGIESVILGMLLLLKPFFSGIPVPKITRYLEGKYPNRHHSCCLPHDRHWYYV